MRTVYNLSSDAEFTFDDNTLPEYAVVYAYTHDDEKAFRQFMLEIHNFQIDYSKYPLVRGKYSIACGDWATLY